jgi:peptidoglycan/xylan/chitin deacetylase (PgdA/CDA1 family)
MAATPLPRRTPQSAHRASIGPARLRVRWDRVNVLLALVVVLATVVTHAVVVAISDNLKAATAKPAASMAVEVSEPAAKTQRQCPPPARDIIHTAPTVPGDGDAIARTVALTFDDSPGPSTSAILDILRQGGVRATFFVIGQQAAAEPEMLRRIAADGHALGDHTWSHRTPSLRAGWKSAMLAKEIERTNQAILNATGLRPCLFRPPGGVVKGASRVTRTAGLSMILWSVDPRDWAAPPSKKFAPVIQKRVAAGLKEEHPVILLHDGGGNRVATVAALAGIISDYRSHGYRFVTLDELG